VARRFAEPRLVLASHNPGKLVELRELLAGEPVEVIPAAALALAEPVETGRTFAANARIKAHAAAAAAGLPALADDSGLTVAGLGGRPGVRSARWAGPERDFDRAMARVRDELAARYGSFAAADRRAAFVAAICLAWPDGDQELARGRVAGELVYPPRGQGGFGYDPMFRPTGSDRTFAELPRASKQALSHRGRALRQLIERCFGGSVSAPQAAR
jgi:XTP/dITP diphosphohydrolase